MFSENVSGLMSDRVNMDHRIRRHATVMIVLSC